VKTPVRKERIFEKVGKRATKVPGCPGKTKVQQLAGTSGETNKKDPVCDEGYNA